MSINFDWENPEVFKRNKQDGHVLAFHYEDEKSALNREESPFKKTLNGEWKFYWQMGLKDCPADFYKTDFG